jgi:hypothetical protein
VLVCWFSSGKRECGCNGLVRKRGCGGVGLVGKRGSVRVLD